MNSFGQHFRISVFGESHGAAVGVVIDGCPPGIPVKIEDFFEDLERRKGGKRGTTSRKEADLPKILSGVFNGFTTGTPIAISLENNDVVSKDYEVFRTHPRPGHTDFVAEKKYHGFQDYRGSGHFSGRLTLPLVAAGVIAKKIAGDITIRASLIEAGGIPDIDTAIAKAIESGDSIGGIVECRVSKLPVGLGEPFFDSVESLISHLIFSIPGTKGIEFGAGFQSASMTGSEHNDWIIDEQGQTETNNAGGINGGITNGNDLVFRVAVKPPSSISKIQQTYNFKQKKQAPLKINGRHDVCIALRVPVIVEAVTAIVLADLFLREKAKS